MKTKLAAAIAATVVISVVFLALMPRIPSTLAQFSWTDNISFYRDVTAVYTDIRKITNNETIPVDVRVYLTSTENIEFLDYYKLSANGTDFIIISGGEVLISDGTYYGLEPDQTLCFTIEARGASFVSEDDTARVGVRVDFWSAEYEHDVAITSMSPSKTIVGQEYPMHVNVTVQNQGNFTETFDVTCSANTTIIETQTVVDLAIDESVTLTFTWDTTEIPYGNYTISAVADTIPEETDTADNSHTGGIVLVTIAGDVNGDKTVNGVDLSIVSQAYGSSKGEPRYNPIADINEDELVDIRDIFLVARNLGKAEP